MTLKQILLLREMCTFPHAMDGEEAAPADSHPLAFSVKRSKVLDFIDDHCRLNFVKFHDGYPYLPFPEEFDEKMPYSAFWDHQQERLKARVCGEPPEVVGPFEERLWDESEDEDGL